MTLTETFDPVVRRLEQHDMATRIGKAKLKPKDGRTRVEMPKRFRNKSHAIGAKKKADRLEAKWKGKSK